MRTVAAAGRGLAVALLSCLVFGGSAVAGGASTDPNDTFGPLDVKMLTQARADGGQLFHAVSMWPQWSNSAVHAHLNFVEFDFNVDKDRIVERSLEVHTDKGSLFAAMTCYCGGRDKLIGYAKVWRPDDHTVAVEFPRSMLGAHIIVTGGRSSPGTQVRTARTASKAATLLGPVTTELPTPAGSSISFDDAAALKFMPFGLAGRDIVTA